MYSLSQDLRYLPNLSVTCTHLAVLMNPIQTVLREMNRSFHEGCGKRLFIRLSVLHIPFVTRGCMIRILLPSPVPFRLGNNVSDANFISHYIRKKRSESFNVGTSIRSLKKRVVWHTMCDICECFQFKLLARFRYYQCKHGRKDIGDVQHWK